MEQAIAEWADIQNIVVDKQFNKFALETLGANEEDICELFDPAKCEKTMHCILYKPDKCVGEKRKYLLHEPNIYLTSKSGLSFIVLDSMYLSKIQLTTNKIDIYYCMVKSIQSDNIYVLFSSGIVLTYDELYNNKELNDGLNLLIAKLTSHKNKKIILGGHSMGCVLALYTGYKMQSFSGMIVGTAGAKWIANGVNFTNQPNIKIFISGELRHNKKKDSMFLDCFINEGDADLQSYNPVNVIYLDTEDGTPHEIPYDMINYNVVFPEKTTTQCKKFHQWNYYFNILRKLYPVTPARISRIRKTKKSITQYNKRKSLMQSFTRYKK